MIYIFLFSFIFWLIIIFTIFLYVFKLRLEWLERKINDLFVKRTDLIPSFFAVSIDYIVKHDVIFDEIIKLRNKELFYDYNSEYFLKILYLESMIHSEFSFLFKIFNEHQKLTRNWKFLYLRELLIDSSSKLWKKISIYKILLKKYNRLIELKNYTIIWLIIPFFHKEEI